MQFRVSGPRPDGRWPQTQPPGGSRDTVAGLKEPGSKRPDYGNSKVVFEVALEPGRYSFSGWQYEDTGNISLEIQKMTEVSDERGFDD